MFVRIRCILFASFPFSTTTLPPGSLALSPSTTTTVAQRCRILPGTSSAFENLRLDKSNGFLKLEELGRRHPGVYAYMMKQKLRDVK